MQQRRQEEKQEKLHHEQIEKEDAKWFDDRSNCATPQKFHKSPVVLYDITNGMIIQ